MQNNTETCAGFQSPCPNERVKGTSFCRLHTEDLGHVVQKQAAEGKLYINEAQAVGRIVRTKEPNK